ncbi:MAG TPA: hypothetical protein VD710_02555 [Nitrososphaeraceae archaeon]|nr:hypothetical protein [Nitrososphaeraceae archaeon]
MIYETLKRLQRKQPSYIYLDETDGKIKERPLQDSAGGASINHSYKNPAKLIHDSIFHELL